MAFKVDLDVFRGPLDLLLYLVQQHELEPTEFSISRVVDQYMEYLSVLSVLDVDSVGDFLVVASTLVELKSRALLPNSETGEEVLEEDPQQELVQRLLEYKKFRDAASLLEDKSRLWQERFPRQASSGPRRTGAEEIRDVELWDLVSAFGRILKEQYALKPASIIYDDTPIQVFMTRIHSYLVARGTISLPELIHADMHRSTIVGIFLALLELVRHYHVRLEQADPFGRIDVVAGEMMPRTPLDLSNVDNYERIADPVQ
jgi:segregation and condensation protein A